MDVENGRDSGGISLGSFALGVVSGMALGVVATVIFAAYKEEQFNSVVKRTREIGDQAQQTAESLQNTVGEKVGSIAEATKTQFGKATKAVKERVNGASEEMMSRNG